MQKIPYCLQEFSACLRAAREEPVPTMVRVAKNRHKLERKEFSLS